MIILVLNPGSSSLKFALLRVDIDSETRLAGGLVERIGGKLATVHSSFGDKPQESTPVSANSMRDAVEAALKSIERAVECTPIDRVACRVVHGADQFVGPAKVDLSVLEAIRGLSSLAPLHNPVSVEAIETVQRIHPEVPLFAVFDTAFHNSMPQYSALYPIPLEFARDQKLRRYGFHGISHSYVSGQVFESGRQVEGCRMISCHLGHGASVCAIKAGLSVDTSMGLTPLEGLMMSTRCGDLDAGLVLHLIEHCGISPGELDRMLNSQSGLLGISGLSDDTRDLEKAETAGNERAKLALDMFAYRVRKYIGAYLAALGGLDELIFTGGIGENSANIRSRICTGLEFLGVELNTTANEHRGKFSSMQTISPFGTKVTVRVVRTDEELQMARECAAASG